MQLNKLHSRRGRLTARIFLASYRGIPSRQVATHNVKIQNRLPAAYYRGGTSRAIIFKSQDLPKDGQEAIFRGVLGSPDPNGRQLDGLGGGLSSLSKICIVGPSTHPEADVDYTFVAVGIKDSEVDYSSNCGNMTSAIGPFAVDSGMVGKREDGKTRVRIHNTNTGKLIHSTFNVVAGEAATEGNFAIDGVAGTADRIQLAFINPAGSKTGKFLPTGNVVDIFGGIKATCIDVGNPCVFVSAADLKAEGTMLPDSMETHPDLLPRLDAVRRKASVAMGVSKDEDSVPGSIPKIAMVSSPSSHILLSGERMNGNNIDLVVRAISVGQPHRAVPLTVAMSLAAAANLEGSTVNALLNADKVDPSGLSLGHPSGTIVVGSNYDREGSLTDATVFTTARRLMDGLVYWKSSR